MRIVGTRTVKITSLKLPGDMRLRMESPRVQQLAASFTELGQLQDPVIRWQKKGPHHMRLLAGRDRVAAHMLRDDVDVDVKMVECTDEEAHRVEHTENAIRRHNVEEQRKSLAELLHMKEVATESLRKELYREPTMRAVNTRVGEALNILPETVERKERDLRAATNQKAAPKVVETWGLELELDWSERFQRTIMAMELLASKVTQALTAASFLSDPQLMPPSIGQDIRQELAQVSAHIRAHIPVALCPYCKGQDEVLAHCGGCLGSGWIGRQKLAAVPEELKDTEDPRVYLNGKLTAVSELGGAGEPTDIPPVDDLRATDAPAVATEAGSFVDDDLNPEDFEPEDFEDMFGGGE